MKVVVYGSTFVVMLLLRCVVLCCTTLFLLFFLDNLFNDYPVEISKFHRTVLSVGCLQISPNALSLLFTPTSTCHTM